MLCRRDRAFALTVKLVNTTTGHWTELEKWTRGEPLASMHPFM